jgi:cell division protein FtsB
VLLQVAQLQAEVASKQAQLQALSLEHMALAAKARALDQLLASAGEGRVGCGWHV